MKTAAPCIPSNSATASARKAPSSASLMMATPTASSSVMKPATRSMETTSSSSPGSTCSPRASSTKKPFDQLADVLQLVSQAEKELQSDGGRVLLRYSGTEPKARLLIEGRDNDTLQRWSTKIADAIKQQVGT